jgi:hypothetical protein
MPVYAFPTRMAERIASHQQRQGIRRKRSRPTAPNDELKLYSSEHGFRAEKFIASETCRAVRDIVRRGNWWFWQDASGEYQLSPMDVEQLARACGYRDGADMNSCVDGEADYEVISW